MLRTLWLALSIVGSLLLVDASATAFADNSDQAHLCQKLGYREVMGKDGTRFRNVGDCVSYAARGGTIVPIPTATLTWNKTFEWLFGIGTDRPVPIPIVELIGAGFIPNSSLTITIVRTALNGDPNLTFTWGPFALQTNTTGSFTSKIGLLVCRSQYLGEAAASDILTATTTDNFGNTIHATTPC